MTKPFAHLNLAHVVSISKNRFSLSPASSERRRESSNAENSIIQLQKDKSSALMN